MIDRASLASLLLEVRSETGAPLGSATGFLVRWGAAIYLITNRHVVRGRRQDDEQPIHASGACPSTITIVHKRVTAGGTIGWEQKQESLYEPDGTPRWLEHPVHGGRVDVVGLGLRNLTAVEVVDHDPSNRNTPAIAVGPADPLSIIGFPFGRTAGGYLAIWVTGTVASEMAVNFDGLPSYLIDSRTREGQSGSPVIAHRSGGMVRMENGDLTAFNGPVQRFLGVYSGRINKESDLGLVWKAPVIADILATGPPQHD